MALRMVHKHGVFQHTLLTALLVIPDTESLLNTGN